MIKSIIFDFHGPVMAEAAGPIYEKHSLQRGFEKDAIKKLVRKYYSGAHVGEYKDWFEFFKKAESNLKITPEEMTDITEEMHLTKTVIPEMRELILKLKTKYKTGLLTNFTADLPRFIQSLRIRELFNVIVNSHDIGLEKPDPKIYYHILNLLDTKPEEAIFTDDKPENVQAAIDIGMKGIVFDNPKQFYQDLITIIGKI